MVPTIPITTHDMDKKIEDKPLTCYQGNAIFDPDMGEILQYKDIMQSKEEKQEPFGKNCLSKEFGRLTDGLLGKFHKGMSTTHFVARNNIPVGRTFAHSRIVVHVQPYKEEPI